ncbi:MAG: radical SAM protein [Sulfuricella sp.]|nr:radical SAM protein [Sulfuricella sp.]
MTQLLGISDHDRDSAALTYVYPVVSRRSGGVSVGINLNTNHACNWRCIYCQVPDLQRGSAPPADLALLGRELRGFLHELLEGDFMGQRVPPEARRLNDIALSGNGEPTSTPNFEEVVELIGTILKEFALLGKIKLVLITNGSLMFRPSVQAGLEKMAQLNGEVWFKLDRATSTGIKEINDSALSTEKVREHLTIAARRCPTWLQTCLFNLDGLPPSDEEKSAYINLVESLAREGARLRGIMLYGLARPSLQAEAPRLGAITETWATGLVAELEKLGLEIRRNGV